MWVVNCCLSTLSSHNSRVILFSKFSLHVELCFMLSDYVSQITIPSCCNPSTCGRKQKSYRRMEVAEQCPRDPGTWPFHERQAWRFATGRNETIPYTIIRIVVYRMWADNLMLLWFHLSFLSSKCCVFSHCWIEFYKVLWIHRNY